MANARLVSWFLLCSLVLAACSSSRAPTSAEPAVVGEAKPVPSAPQRTLIMVANQVPADFAGRALAGGVGSGTGVAENIPEVIFNAQLAIGDERGGASPYLAESLPQLNTDTWRLLPDGTMETIYKLRPNLTWHDGQPLTANDFTFAWEVYKTPEYGVDRSIPFRFMSDVQAPDARTVVIRWGQRWAGAGKLGSQRADQSFPPLPRHLLEAEHREGTGRDAKFLPNSSFWTERYVGAGPYKLDSYTPGVSIEAVAFDAHVLGRPKIDRVSIRGIPDVNTALAATVAGEVHYGADLFRAQEGVVLERDWVAKGQGVVLWEALGSRGLHFQLRPERAAPLEAATDVRVRRAIAHAIDKREPFEVVTMGKGILSDTFTHPNAPYHAQIDREITKYPHDLRRAEQLLVDAGFTRSGGQWITPRGEPAELPIWYTGGAALFEQENTILVAQLKQFGLAATSRLFPSGGSREDRALSPGIIGGSGGGADELSTQEIPTAATRWAGRNRGGYSNPEMDRLIASFEGSVDPSERVQLLVQMEKIISNDVPVIFLYYHSRAWTHVANLKGPKIRLVEEAGNPIRNVHEWEWTS